MLISFMAIYDPPSRNSFMVEDARMITRHIHDLGV